MSTDSYNKKVGRRGPLWEQRFKSILVEGEQGILSAMSAYIDLNCIRARMVRIPRTTATAAPSRPGPGLLP